MVMAAHRPMLGCLWGRAKEVRIYEGFVVLDKAMIVGTIPDPLVEASTVSSRVRLQMRSAHSWYLAVRA